MTAVNKIMEDIIAHVDTEEEFQDKHNSEDDCSEQNSEKDITAHVDTEEEFHDEHNSQDDCSEKNFEENIVAHVDTEEECQDEHNSVDEDNEIENVGDFEQHFIETKIMSPDQIDSKNFREDLSRELQY